MQTAEQTQRATLNLRYLKESVSHLDELMEKQKHSTAYHSLLKEALSDIDLEVAILKNSVEHPR
jgi:hypothetical protein